jgi:hypothetical protein
MPAAAMAQLTFEELVDRSFGSDQSLVNGIQFSNQYIRIVGNPYFLDGRYRSGSVCINDQLYEEVRLRYNLYTQKIEIEYRAPEGHMNQLITVPEQISAFWLADHEFRRMQIGEDEAGYYMVLSSKQARCYIGWSLDAIGGGNSERRFSPIARKYWLQQGEHWTAFHDRKSYLRTFPKERKKEFRDLLKTRKFYFNQASTAEMVALIRATIRLLEEGEEP